MGEVIARMERLQKVIARAGVTSRRNAEKLIIDGKVKVNGQIVRELGTKVTGNEKIEVEGVPIEREAPVYFLFYKPSGVISSAKDEKGRKVVTDFFKHVDKRLFPVGRLDYDTTGVILLTNDGEFANILMHPRHEIEKDYVAKIEGIPDLNKLKMLQRGVKLEDGKTAPAKVKILSGDQTKGTAIVRIVIHEGRNRQIRRMFEAIGHPVKKLKRERYGFLDLTGLSPGDYRELSPKEVKQIRNLAVTQPSK